MSTPSLLTAREVLDLVYAGASKLPDHRAVYRWAGRGVGPSGTGRVRLASVATPSGLRFRRADVEAFMAALATRHTVGLARGVGGGDEAGRRKGGRRAKGQRPAWVMPPAELIGTYPLGRTFGHARSGMGPREAAAAVNEYAAVGVVCGVGEMANSQ